jgi:hypothetical protein
LNTPTNEDHKLLFIKKKLKLKILMPKGNLIKTTTLNLFLKLIY